MQVGTLSQGEYDMGNSTFKTPEQYLFNTAKHVLGQIGGVDPEKIGVHFSSDEWPMMFWSEYGGPIIGALIDHGPEALGRIAVASPSHLQTHNITHWDMDQGKHLTDAASGKDVLRMLAAYCVGAKIANIVRDGLAHEEQAAQFEDDLLDRAMHHDSRPIRPIPDARRYEDCDRCHGTGDDPASSEMYKQAHGPDGPTMPCDHCGGTGKAA